MLKIENKVLETEDVFDFLRRFILNFSLKLDLVPFSRFFMRTNFVQNSIAKVLLEVLSQSLFSVVGKITSRTAIRG